MTHQKNSIGEIVRTFYNATPFPDYDLERFNTIYDLEGAAYPFARALDASIPKDASIIDVGTGTGQLCAYLSRNRKNVWGIDFSDSSLSKAGALKEKLGLDSWTLKKVDILDRDQLKSIGQTFDYVLCMGVLHHTGDAYQGFQNITSLLNDEGRVALGLYNKFGRIPLKIRIFLAKTIFRNNDKMKDWFIKMQIGEVEDKQRARGWWSDQYLHPHETTHSIGEVLRWFEKNNITYHHTLPSCVPGYEPDREISGLWNTANETYPSAIIRAYIQYTWIWKTHQEGGYWITFGSKKDP